MTQELIKRFAEQNGLSTIRAMVVLVELLGKKEKDTAPTVPIGNDMIPHFSIEAIGWK